MNLTDLQMELRSIEEHISVLQTEIERMKPKSEEEKEKPFAKITNLAKKYPLPNRKLAGAEFAVKKAYISCLAYIAFSDENSVYDKLLYLSRVAAGIGLEFGAEDIRKMGMEFDENDLEELCIELNEWKHSLLIEALILVNLTGGTGEICSLAADIALILKFDKDELRNVAYAAKAVLTDDFGSFDEYAGSIGEDGEEILRRHITLAHRIFCGRYLSYENTERRSFVKNVLPAGSRVKKGDTLVTYFNISNPLKENRICAPCDGVVSFESMVMESNIDTLQQYVFVSVYIVS